ncbi:DegT/DnrJ/EryC1/StrS family aminotransferase [Tenacibaculum maritimum]|uniref:DegT/DnrJ/EryC1/StrS family aminotransferase n=1 Tax=Tenacibaculum maritimum TaxID=107401 RepID=UPI0012E67D44|nr:DegT/DnrJ/EryC1/StrS family aminotransferase [Tenacibaculum maritimum]MCD9582901.1 DegT/DnrJ/EryC1/StrS family aminotransferase [Tenacibaculum maritimum]MCD9637137.1 DegT/DnrJ/EryC1/StrS family aminotransferase [Tenacibaculum maritimum]CAA0153919.1 DegT/DnrJ/EryC1/StrS aminotransferase family protein [Tenacibaculum maritimum]CAA0157673.1 DegT/DnrJ/EryC1/StrS aminotransferase family protein [Tenacibaculum maritimum]CAA0158466.1 DegT/DnrJ/EryC1/StrS aminotransferase family protein [Tenacibacu
MRKIQMVDLPGQYQHIKSTVDACIQEVLDSATYINGPYVKEFQTDLEKYLGVKHVIPCANGTDALQIAMMGLGLEEGDEVITADFTFAATVEVIGLLKFTPVLVDVEPDTYNISIDALKKAITPKTKAIVPVHLFGQCANMERILEIAKEHGLFVIEDNAQAIGADYTFSDGTKKKAGTMGNVGTTSFFPSKNLGCYGDGGAIFTNDDELAHTLRGIVNHGMYKRYYHDVVGVNSRLDSIQAAVLKTKLPLLDSYCDARRKAADYYTNAFKDNPHIITPITSSFTSHVFHQYTLRITNGKRNELHQYLLEKNIPNAIYYPVPLHAQKAYQDKRYTETNFPVTNQLIDEVISLPMHTELDEDQLMFITKTVLDFIK